jgi:hypothetical protein
VRPIYVPEQNISRVIDGGFKVRPAAEMALRLVVLIRALGVPDFQRPVHYGNWYSLGMEASDSICSYSQSEHIGWISLWVSLASITNF